MKQRIYFHTTILFFILIICSCSNNNNRAYFTIDNEDRKVSVLVYLNDSIPANLAFDTGGNLVLDSTLCTKNPSILSTLSSAPDTSKKLGSGWTTSRVQGVLYNNVNQSIKIGNEKTYYNALSVYNWKKYMNSPKSDGMFNIQKGDSSHVWELNFEHNYMEIHDANSFKIPESTILIPFEKNKYNYSRFFIQLPIQVICSDGSTLSIQRSFFIDTAMPWDIAIIKPAEEFDFFDKKSDVVWTRYLNSYNKYSTVKANIFNKVEVDSLRIYTFNQTNSNNITYFVGLNFLKRFNLFFDMKNKQLGLQPLKHFKRVINPLHQRYHYDVTLTNEGKYILSEIADYKDNYFKTAGLRKGDEVIKINDMPAANISSVIFEKFLKRDIMIFDITRNGKPLKITVCINHNEKQGD